MPAFVIKIDYDTGDIIWILGDPTKYWYTFPSLRAKALTITNGGLYPMGQHAPSVTSTGLLMVFNNGAESFNQPAGAPVGGTLAYSRAHTKHPGKLCWLATPLSTGAGKRGWLASTSPAMSSSTLNMRACPPAPLVGMRFQSHSMI
jgi:hypothetical protein